MSTRYPKCVGQLWSVRMLADEFGIGRNTVIKRIRQSGIKPDDQRDKNDVYKLGRIIPVLFEFPTAGPEETIVRSATDQLAIARAEDSRVARQMRELQLAREEKRLVPADDARLEMANIAKSVCQMLDTLPDVLERGADLSPKAVVLLGELIAKERDNLAKFLAS